MSIKSVDGSKVIELEGFKIGDEILLSDSDSIGNYKKVKVLLPQDYLEFLITDRGILEDLDIYK